MKLTPTEIAWINNELDTHQIMYQEIYDEIKDHIITAIETVRANGDERNVALVFSEVMSAQFPGYRPFEEIAEQYQRNIKSKTQCPKCNSYKIKTMNRFYFFSVFAICLMLCFLIWIYAKGHFTTMLITGLTLFGVMAAVAYILMVGKLKLICRSCGFKFTVSPTGYHKKITS
jgi:predicted Zn-ribbon and HTH transcriptional regulator